MPQDIFWENTDSTTGSGVRDAIVSELSASSYNDTNHTHIENNSNQFLPQISLTIETSNTADNRALSRSLNPSNGNDLPLEFGTGQIVFSDSSLEGLEFRGPDGPKVEAEVQPVPEGQTNQFLTSDATTDGQLQAELFHSKVPIEVQGALSVFLTDLSAGNIEAIGALFKNAVAPEERASFIEHANKMLERRGIKLSFGGTPTKPNTDELLIQRTTLGTANGDKKPFSQTEALCVSSRDGSVKAFRATTDETGEPKNEGELKPSDVANGMKRWLGLVARSDTAAKIFQDAEFGSDDSKKTLTTLMQSAYKEFGEVGCRQLAENLKHAAELDRKVNKKAEDLLKKDSLSVHSNKDGNGVELRFGGKNASLVVEVPFKP